MRSNPHASAWTSAWLIGALALGAVLSGCAQTPPSDAEADPATREAIVTAHNALIDAYQAGNIAALVALLDDSDDLLIFHAMTENRFESINEVRAGLPRMFAKLQGATWAEAHPKLVVRGNVAWLTSHVSIDSPNVPEPFIGRGTEIWVKRAGDWRLTHGHWSENPEL